MNLANIPTEALQAELKRRFTVTLPHPAKTGRKPKLSVCPVPGCGQQLSAREMLKHYSPRTKQHRMTQQAAAAIATAARRIPTASD